MQAIKYFIRAEISDIALKSPIAADFSTEQIEQQNTSVILNRTMADFHITAVIL